VKVRTSPIADSQLTALVPVVEPPDIGGKAKGKSRSQALPPDLDRSGEMPDGAEPTSAPSQPPDAIAKKGLAAVDLLDTTNGSKTVNSSRFEEYKMDEKEEVQGDIPAAVGDVEVVRVKRKKKRVVGDKGK
jgi:hypothetical protein